MDEKRLLDICNVKSMNLSLAKMVLSSSYHISDIFRDDYDELSYKRRERSQELFQQIKTSDKLIRTLKNSIKIKDLEKYQKERNNLYRHFITSVEKSIQNETNEIKTQRCIRKRIKKLNVIIKRLENRIVE